MHKQSNAQNKQNKQDNKNKENQNKQNKTLLTLAILLFVSVLLFFTAYQTFAPQTSEGSKTITLKVIDNTQTTVSYTVHTNATYLLDAMKDAPNLSFSGREDTYGLTLITLNGISADFNKGDAFWCIYVNEEMGNYGIETQPVTDGDVIQFVYTELHTDI